MRRFVTVFALFAALLLRTGSPAAAVEGAPPPPGNGAPGFTAPLIDGGDFDLAPLLGNQVILLDFWSIYCVSCVQQLPALSALSGRYGSRVQVVGVNLDSFGTRRVAQFVKGLEPAIPYPVVIDKNRQAAARYGVTELPTTVFIDRRGTIRGYHVGFVPGDEPALEQELMKALAAPPDGPAP